MGILTAEEINELKRISDAEIRAKKEADRKAKEEEKQRQKEERAAEKKKAKIEFDFSQERMGNIGQATASVIHSKAKWFRLGEELGKVNTDEDIKQRIEDFWKICEQSGEIPNKHDFFAFMQVSVQEYAHWRRGEGCSTFRAEMLQEFDNMYNSVKDTLANLGIIDKLTYIWQSKQAVVGQGYKEPKQEIDIAQNSPLIGFADQATLANKYGSDLMLNDGEE